MRRHVAFLILAHRDGPMLGRLARRLEAPWAETIVHVDARADASTVAAHLPSSARLVPDAERVAVWYGGVGMVEATLVLLRTALTDPNIQRVFLLSGADYLVRPLDLIADLPAGHEIIRVDRRLDPRGRSWFDKTAYRHHVLDNAWLNPRTGHPLVLRASEKVWALLRRNGPGIPVYHGPSWWSLTRPTVAAILERLDREPRLLRWFRGARFPEELLFQTLVKQIPGVDIVIDCTDPAALPTRDPVHATHYVDFSQSSGASPKTLVLDDYAAVMASSGLFARKVDGEESRLLLDRMDASL